MRLPYLCPKSVFFVPFKMGELHAFESFRLIFPRPNFGLYQVSMAARRCSVYHILFMGESEEILQSSPGMTGCGRLCLVSRNLWKDET